MRAFSFVAISSIVGGAVAVNTTGTPCATNFLDFNSTNVASLAACTKLNYRCDHGNYSELMEYNSTTGPVPDNCSPFYYNIAVDEHVNGSLSIPDVVSVGQAVFQGQWPILPLYPTDTSVPEDPLNLTSLELPDLVNITQSGGFEIDWADKIESLKVPKLTNIMGDLQIDLSGENPPAINLSFPSLYYVGYGISLTGNIDAVDLPALNNTLQVNITSTGNLDCMALTASVVNATNAWLSLSSNANYSVICNSKKGSVTTYRAHPTSRSSGKRLRVRGDPVVLMGLVGFIFIL